MLWNVYVIGDGECRKLNDEPYEADMIGMALEQLAAAAVPVDSVSLVPCSKKPASFEQLYSDVRQTGGNAWDDVDVLAELAELRSDSAETETSQ